eukprot:SAG31_NODE_459_length_15396_cov_5.092502_14_plen_188_part_00
MWHQLTRGWRSVEADFPSISQGTRQPEPKAGPPSAPLALPCPRASRCVTCREEVQYDSEDFSTRKKSAVADRARPVPGGISFACRCKSTKLDSIEVLNLRKFSRRRVSSRRGWRRSLSAAAGPELATPAVPPPVLPLARAPPVVSPESLVLPSGSDSQQNWLHPTLRGMLQQGLIPSEMLFGSVGWS